MGGGDDRGRTLETVEAYNPRTNTWRSCLPLSQRRCHAVAGVVGGRLVVAGGFGDGHARLTSVEAYTPTGWTPLPPLPHATYGGTACVLKGRLYVMGGMFCNKLQVLEMSEGNVFTWTVKAELPSEDRWYATSAVFQGRLLLIGGIIGNANTTSVSIYDPASDSWAAGPAIPGLWNTRYAVTHEGDVRLFTHGNYPALAYRNGAWVEIPDNLEGRSAYQLRSVLLG